MSDLELTFQLSNAFYRFVTKVISVRIDTLHNLNSVVRVRPSYNVTYCPQTTDRTVKKSSQRGPSTSISPVS